MFTSASSYTYDANGNITSIRLNGALYESYTYDHLNQLKTVTKGDDTWRYTYDSCGNILTVKLNGEVTESYGYSDIQWKDKLTNLNGQTVTYDAIGNPLQYRDGMTFSWKYGRTLEYLYSENYNIFYRQNADGIRVQKHVTDNADSTTESHYYDYNGTMLVCESWGDNTVWYMYDESGSPIGLTYNGTEYYYLKNLQGDITGIADANGSIVAEYTYNAWGKLLSITDADGNDISSNTAHIGTINPLRYRGYYYDNETGLYYVTSRYYDPEVGRWINADGYISTGQGIAGTNMFAYCGNNPANRDDPTGELWATLIDKITNIIKRMVCTIRDGVAFKEDTYLTQLQKQNNATIVYNYLQEKGWSHNAICATLGNMEQESNINPAFNQRGGGGFGLVQWDPASKYTDWADVNGYANNSITGQLEYMIYSMQPGQGEWFKNRKFSDYYLSASSYISSNCSVEYLTAVFLYSYERAGNAKLDLRKKYARYWSEYFS